VSSGATNDTLVVSNTTLTNNNQQFRCIVNSGSCTDTSNIANLTVINNVGINETTGQREFEIYPNPATEILIITLSGKADFVLIDAIGREVKQGVIVNQNQISVSDLIAGIYVVQVKTEHSVYTSKFLKL